MYFIVEVAKQYKNSLLFPKIDEGKQYPQEITNGQNTSHYQLRVIMSKGKECTNEMSLEYQCSEYSMESECKSACGFGTRDGACHWIPENR